MSETLESVCNEIRASIAALDVAQAAYEKARRHVRTCEDALADEKSSEPTMKRAAIADLVAGGATKTDAPKMLDTHPGYVRVMRDVERAEHRRDVAQDDLSIARQRVNTARAKLLALTVLADHCDSLEAGAADER